MSQGGLVILTESGDVVPRETAIKDGRAFEPAGPEVYLELLRDATRTLAEAEENLEDNMRFRDAMVIEALQAGLTADQVREACGAPIPG